MPLIGGVVYNPHSGKRVSWKPAGPVVDAWNFISSHRNNGFTCLGVIGNSAHLNSSGDHTPWSTHRPPSGISPKFGWVYAIDMNFGKLADFERWFLAALRAGKYPEVKYWNILNRHWNRSSGFKRAIYSGDHHCHISFMPNYEYSRSTLMIDFYNAIYLRKPTPVPIPPKPVPGNYVTHTVVSGDTLSAIATKYNVTLDELIKLNGIKDANEISVGQILKVKLAPVPTTRPTRPAVISGVRRIFDPNRLGHWRITLSNKVVPFADVTGVPANDLAKTIKFVPGFGGKESEIEAKLVEYIVFLVGKNSGFWFSKLSPSLIGDPTKRTYEFTSTDCVVFRDLTYQQGGTWNPGNPVDTLRAMGHTDTWWS